MTGLAAIVPFRGLESGKQRLRPLFDTGQRATLARRMLRGVVEALATSGTFAAIGVVTLDPRVASVLSSFVDDVTLVEQPSAEPGMLGGLETGLRWARGVGMSELLVISADLPLLTGRDLQALTARDAAVVIGPDRHLTGTNALLLRLDSLPGEQPFRFRFGIGSYTRHVAEAERQGIETATALTRGTMFDLDTPADWHALPPTIQTRLLGHPEPVIARHDVRQENALCL
jgi:2-phospho-L-lactate guanylyltransferase